MIKREENFLSKNNLINGEVISRHDYQPFGEEVQRASYGTDQVRQKFTSYERDNESSLDFAQARYYNFNHGRFTAVDPLKESAKADDPRSWNRYTYTLNNPLRFIDPTGMITGDFYDREGYYLGTDGIDDEKIYLLNEGKKANTENKEVNWRGTLKKEHADALKRDSTQVGGLIILERQEEGEEKGGYTAGAFWSVGGGKNSVDGYMIEPAGPDTTERNQDKRVPEGVYDLHEHNGKKFKDTFGISNKDVPADRGIVFHRGYNGSWTEGCLMPGGTIRNGVIEAKTSEPKLEKLKTFIKSKGASNVKLIIRNRIRN